MALVVETGAGVPGANAYISVTELDAYWSARNVSLHQTGAQKEAAIIIATQYVDLNNDWKGSAVDVSQSLGWPRTGAVTRNGAVLSSTSIPAALKNAVAEYAKRQLYSELQPDVGDTGAVKRTRSKVDVLETETEYQDATGGYFGLRRYPLADGYLKNLTRGGFAFIGCQ